MIKVEIKVKKNGKCDTRLIQYLFQNSIQKSIIFFSAYTFISPIYIFEYNVLPNLTRI